MYPNNRPPLFSGLLQKTPLIKSAAASLLFSLFIDDSELRWVRCGAAQIERCSALSVSLTVRSADGTLRTLYCRCRSSERHGILSIRAAAARGTARLEVGARRPCCNWLVGGGGGLRRGGDHPRTEYWKALFLDNATRPSCAAPIYEPVPEAARCGRFGFFVSLDITETRGYKNR